MSITLLLALTVAAGPAQAQPAPTTPAVTTAQTDARFSHWLGCWRLEDDLVGTGARVCVTPERETCVRLQTLVGAQRGLDEIVLPDGVTRPIADAECKGTDRSEWSSDGLRVFRYIDVTCGKEPASKVSSVAFLSTGPSWINVQYVEGPSRSVRVQRYRRAIDQTLGNGSKAPGPTARMLSQAPAIDARAWSTEDVIEASAKLPADAVQAAISELRGPFDLNKRTLVAMDKANVPEAVIDLMVALTYPKRFVVERAGGGGGYASPMGLSMGGGWYDPFLSPFGYSQLGSCYSYSDLAMLNGLCNYVYSPYGNYGYGLRGYGSYGGYYGNYYPNYGGNWIYVDSGPNVPGSQVTTPGEGRVVNGRGYTQVRPRDPEPAPIRNGSISNGASYGSTGGSSGGSSGVSSQGYSGGGSGGSSSGGGERTAVSRPPGGGH